MSVSTVVTNDDGTERTVFADNQKDLDEAVKVQKGQAMPTYPNINKPVAKGHDKVEVQDDLSTVLVDGVGAHNSPHDAINADGSVEGAWDGGEEPEQISQVNAASNNLVDGRAVENDLPPQAMDPSLGATSEGDKPAKKAREEKSDNK